MEYVWAFLFALLAFLIRLIYCYYSRAFKYWEERGLASVKPSFPAGNIGGVITVKVPFGFVFKKLYNQLKNSGPVAGFYIFTRPGLLITDPEMVKTVLVRDFNYFHDRGLYVNEKVDPLSGHLFSLEGLKWRNMRAKISPTFTTGKMKMMCPIVLGVGDKFKSYLENKVAQNSEIEIKDPFARFTTDVIGTCAFGIQCNTLKDPNAGFSKIGKIQFEPGLFRALKDAFILLFKDTSRWLNLRFIDKGLSDFFIGAVRHTVEYREKNNVSVRDFMQLLIEMKKNGDITIDEAAAQAYVFFLGGFETSSSTMSFTIYELALHPEIQERARKEIEEVKRKYGGDLTYEGFQELEYLDMVIYESLRKYPIVPALNREVSKDYTLPGTDTVIPAGTPVVIPVLGLHHDPEYYPDPDRFDPDRFTEENKKSRHPFTYLPFGEGPRICIGMRFGMMQTRLGLSILLSNYNIEISEKTPVPLKKFNPKIFVSQSVGGIWLKLTPLKREAKHFIDST